MLGGAISVVALWLVIRNMDLARTGEILGRAQPLALAAALLVVAIQALVRAGRWRLLLPRRSDGRRIPLTSVLPALLAGYLGNAVLPARLGEVVRAGLIARRAAVEPAEALGSAVLERILDVLALGVLGVLAALALSAPGWMITAAIVGTIVAVVGVAIAALAGFAVQRAGAPPSTQRWSRLLAPVRQLVTQLATGARVVDRPSTIALALGLTAVAWLLDASIFWLVARALGLDLPPAGAMLVSAVAVLSTAIPTAPGYVGTFELAAVAAAGASGLAGEGALAFAVLSHLVAVLPLALAGALSLWLLGGRSLRGILAPSGGSGQS